MSGFYDRPEVLGDTRYLCLAQALPLQPLPQRLGQLSPEEQNGCLI